MRRTEPGWLSQLGKGKNRKTSIGATVVVPVHVASHISLGYGGTLSQDSCCCCRQAMMLLFEIIKHWTSEGFLELDDGHAAFAANFKQFVSTS